MDKKSILEVFGKFLMENVRDESISDWDMIFSGKMRDADSENIRNSISRFNEKDMETTVNIIPKIVDTVLHHLLWSFEEVEDFEIMYTGNSNAISLRQISDGLAGELYSEAGWISKFSKERK